MSDFDSGYRDQLWVCLEQKDAEIERLRAAYHSSQATVLKYWEQRTSDHKLIVELADWLEYQAIEHMGPEYKEALDLIRRARGQSNEDPGNQA